MDDTSIVTVDSISDDVLKACGGVDDSRAVHSAAERLTGGVIAAKYFQNHHEQAVGIMTRLGYLHRLSVSRFNRRVHALHDWLYQLLGILAEVYRQGEVFISDRRPLPVCKRARAWHCKKVGGKAFCGYCAAKKEKFSAWRLHRVCTPAGIQSLSMGYRPLTRI